MVSDEDLLHQAASGNEGSLEALIYRYHKPIYIYLQRMIKDSSIAEDLTQECFIRLCNALKNGRNPTQFLPWIYRIATNLCKDVWKSAAFRKESIIDHDKLSLHSDKETISSILNRQWEREAVILALDQLKPDERELMILRFYQDLKLQEICEIVELPLNTVKSKLYKTFKKTAKLIQREEVETYAKTREQ